MIENIGAYSQVDYDRGYQKGRADGYSDGIDELAETIISIIDDIGFVNRDSVNQIKDKLKEKHNECE